MWEEVARRVQETGGQVLLDQDVQQVNVEGQRIRSVETSRGTFEGDFFFSTMPVQELIRSLKGTEVPAEVKEVNDGLMYRDFITVGLLLDRLKVKEEGPLATALLKDNWSYIQ